jgi:hypothetical protein
MSIDPNIFEPVFRQNWENARHIKSERIWFMNIFSVISAGALSLLQTSRGGTVLQHALLLFMCLFSLIGLLISLRLKAELEECLAKLQALTAQAEVSQFVALGQLNGKSSRYPKFRWMFPVFYSMATVGVLRPVLVSPCVACCVRTARGELGCSRPLTTFVGFCRSSQQFDLRDNVAGHAKAAAVK